MNKYGIRRTFRVNPENLCSVCGEPRFRYYRPHPFPMPSRYGKGVWLTKDCRCVRLKHQGQREVFAELIKPKPTEILPPAKRNLTFENFRVGSFNEEAFSASVQFAKNFAKNTKGRGLLILGRAGRGKTHLACAIANFLHPKIRVMFAHVPTLLEKVRLGQVDLEALISPDLLILDDIGSERSTDWTLEKLLIIVEGRMDKFKPIVYTTNYNLEELEGRLGSRLASRILNNSLDVVVQGPDWREVQRKQAGDRRKEV